MHFFSGSGGAEVQERGEPAKQGEKQTAKHDVWEVAGVNLLPIAPASTRTIVLEYVTRWH
jgi:hypothetical protein